jgi:DNA-binding MarR family transcriptional regulator
VNIGLLLYIPYRHLENRVMEAIRAAGFDATLAQARLLQRLSPQGSRLTELAEAAQVTKQTASFLVDQLEKAGYVERVPDPKDGRARLIKETEKARAAAPLAGVEIARIEAEWEQHVGKRQLAQVRETLEKLCEITDPYR